MVRTRSLKVKVSSITDGTSNTLMVGERRQFLGELLVTGSSYDNEPCYAAGFNNGTDSECMRVAVSNGSGSWLTPAQNTNVALNSLTGWQFGSSHVGAMNGVFADGSVRVIRYEVDPTLFMRICVRNDGAVVDTSGL